MSKQTNKNTDITFVIERGLYEWTSKQEISPDESEAIVEKIFKPNDKLTNALNTMFRTYFPSEHAKVKSFEKTAVGQGVNIDHWLPWRWHRRKYNEIKTNNQEKEKEKIKTDIKNKLYSSWILSWHWRAALSTIKDYNFNFKKQKKKIIIQISHFRKWEMLLCYSVDSSVVDQYINDLKEIPTDKKTLLRAPLFGISHRLRGWETYRLFYNDDTLEAIEKDFNENLAICDIIGRHDCYYVVQSIDFATDQYTLKLTPQIDLHPEKTTFQLGKFKFEYDRPLDYIEIPAFGNEKVEKIDQLMVSDNYCEAIYDLMEILNDLTVKSVLVIAPPGSGKEQFAKFAFYCRECIDFTVKGENTEPDYIATTLAGLNATEAAKLLFTCFDTTKNTDNPNEFKKYTISPRDGLILRALDGALFIDEIDKADKSVRNLLLRVLESGEITDPNSSKVINIENRVPFYIFSGSMSRKNMFLESPPDFWTRISHIIEIKHPLEYDDYEKGKKVMKEYLWMFWIQHVMKVLRKNPFLNINDKSEVKPLQPLIKYEYDFFKFMLDTITVSFVCEILSNELSGRGKTIVSIRTLRSIIARSFFRLADIIRFAKSEDDSIERYKKELSAKTGEKNLYEVLKEIMPNHNPKKEDKSDDLTNNELLSRVNVLASLTNAIRDGIQLT